MCVFDRKWNLSTTIITSYLCDDETSLCFCLVNRQFTSIFQRGMTSPLFWMKRLEHKLNVLVREDKYTTVDRKEVYLLTKKLHGEWNLLLHDDSYVVGLGLLSGMNPSVKVWGMCDPLYGSCEVGNVEVCKLLLNCGKYDLLRDKHLGYDLLYVSVSEEHTEIVKMLLEGGEIDPSQRGGMILSCCKKSGNHDICELLSSDKRVQTSRFLRYFR